MRKQSKSGFAQREMWVFKPTNTCLKKKNKLFINIYGQGLLINRMKNWGHHIRSQYIYNSILVTLFHYFPDENDVFCERNDNC